MKRKKNTYTPEQKLNMILESMTYPDGIGAYCRTKGIRDALIYKWKEQLQSRAIEVYGPRKTNNHIQIEFEEKLRRKDEIIGELVSENITLKKKYGV
jgi:transposase-like protein